MSRFDLRKFLCKVLNCSDCSKYINEVDELKDTINECADVVEELSKPWDVGIAPDWLNQAHTPYRPMVQIEGENIVLDATDIYMESRTLRLIATPWRDLPIEKRFWEAWKFVITQVNYRYDKQENWLPPIITLTRKWGDCEDTTNLFVTLCRIAHVPADRVFNACGYMQSGDNKFGHSYPIVRMDDGKWYIMESTLKTIPGRPKLFKGSKYDCSWGVANWKFYGKLKQGDQL